jgi:nitroimidazol reductase NimA-like FMN-containing flavoprotein (pyridoxamine 5'-phosphate oxidase superfamily)
MSATAGPQDLTALGRYPERGHYDFATIAGILDAALVCHVGVVSGDQPIVIPSIFARIERNLYLHGSPVARWMNGSGRPARVCVTVSILDALVLARSAYQHSLNYRSVVVLGQPETVTDEAEKRDALQAIVEHACPGRWEDVRPPSSGELRATLVLRIPIAEASAKIRTGPPADFDFDMQRDTWAGLIPLRTVRGAPVPDPALAPGIAVPEYCTQA